MRSVRGAAQPEVITDWNRRAARTAALLSHTESLSFLITACHAWFCAQNMDKGLPAWLKAQADGVLLAVKLQPRASKNEIGGALGEELRIKVTAPPVDAAANEALVRLLAETLDCP